MNIATFSSQQLMQPLLQLPLRSSAFQLLLEEGNRVGFLICKILCSLTPEDGVPFVCIEKNSNKFLNFIFRGWSTFGLDVGLWCCFIYLIHIGIRILRED
jgi:hypothetical protein